VREAIDAGAVVLAGSDWPVVPSVNPWAGMETLVTRKEPGNQGLALAPAHAVTLKESFDIYTVNAATSEGKRDSLGAIEVGLLADLIVVDRNPFDVPIGELHNTQVVGVFIGGESVRPLTTPK
jgi:predicted amidohydrolase YtcJ